MCNSLGFDWVTDWKAAFAGKTKYREALYPHNCAPPYTFYPGASVYHGTNTNSVTYLGACNGDDTETLILEIHRRIAGKWKRVLTVTSRATRSTRSTAACPPPTRERPTVPAAA